MVKLIIALLALNPQGYIDYAQTNFSANAAGYILNNNSAPHVTLAQFYATQQDYQNIYSHLSKEPIIIPTLQFTGISVVKDTKDDAWWIEYSLEREQQLLALHKKVADVLQARGLSLLNNSGDLYRPHLTLARVNAVTINLDLHTTIPHSAFVLVIGEADNLGQFVKILETFPINIE